MSLHLPSPAPTPDQSAPTPAAQPHVPADVEQAAIRAEVEQLLLRLSQDLYEMEICAGDVGQGMEGAVPGYMAKINHTFRALSDLSGRMTEGVPRPVVERVDSYANPHLHTRKALSEATGENQYALGRMLGLESFRRQLHDALSTEFPQMPLPDRRHVPPHEASGPGVIDAHQNEAGTKMEDGQDSRDAVKVEQGLPNGNGSYNPA